MITGPSAHIESPHFTNETPQHRTLPTWHRATWHAWTLRHVDPDLVPRPWRGRRVWPLPRPVPEFHPSNAADIGGDAHISRGKVDPAPLNYCHYHLFTLHLHLHAGLKTHLVLPLSGGVSLSEIPRWRRKLRKWYIACVPHFLTAGKRKGQVLFIYIQCKYV